ncbi:hypothetical protein BaRGS_00023414 [Batillaria attramentaria]|uniref:Uncharacterized protein n=1 Tax=Batillaria attramentaria TaxID=370345 RepID=A0ABD0KEF0_9CAEN
MPRARGQRRGGLTYPRKGSRKRAQERAAQRRQQAAEAESASEPPVSCPDVPQMLVVEEEPYDAPAWTWSDFLLGWEENGQPGNIPQEFEGELQDCDGARAHEFLLVIDNEAVSYDPLEILDLDEHAACLTQDRHLRTLHKLKAELREQDLGAFCLVRSAGDSIHLAAHYASVHFVGVKFALTVLQDFSMHVQVHKDILSPTHKFWSGLPCHGNSITAVCQVLNKLATWKVCPGNTDKQMQKLVPESAAFSDNQGQFVAFREPNMGAAYVSTIRSVKCSMLLPPEDGHARCRGCAVFRKTLLKRVNQCCLKKKGHLTSARVSHHNMTREELCAKLEESRKERYTLQGELARLRKDVFKEIGGKGHKLSERGSEDRVVDSTPLHKRKRLT